MSQLPPYTIIIDTREQSPWSWDNGSSGDNNALTPPIHTIRATLPAGDYSIVGLEDRVAIERKSLNDYVQTVIAQRKRFSRELIKLQSYDYAIIMVEGSCVDLIEHKYSSQADPKSVLGATAAIEACYGVSVLFCCNRQIAIYLAKLWMDKVWAQVCRNK